jgi:hypothetical protein
MACRELTTLGIDLYWPGASNSVPNLVSLLIHLEAEATYMK